MALSSLETLLYQVGIQNCRNGQLHTWSYPLPVRSTIRRQPWNTRIGGARGGHPGNHLHTRRWCSGWWWVTTTRKRTRADTQRTESPRLLSAVSIGSHNQLDHAVRAYAPLRSTPQPWFVHLLFPIQLWEVAPPGLLPRSVPSPCRPRSERVRGEKTNLLLRRRKLRPFSNAAERRDRRGATGRTELRAAPNRALYAARAIHV